MCDGVGATEVVEKEGVMGEGAMGAIGSISSSLDPRSLPLDNTLSSTTHSGSHIYLEST